MIRVGLIGPSSPAEIGVKGRVGGAAASLPDGVSVG